MTLNAVISAVTDSIPEQQHLDHTITNVYSLACGCRGLKNPTKWSECSKQQFAESFHQGMDYCLHNLPQQIYGGAVCGNGFTEDGEECDCGLPQVR